MAVEPAQDGGETLTPTDILKVFDRAVGEFAFVSTYDFDPKFFESRVLGTKGFGSATSIVVLMDSRRYADLLNRGIDGDLFNRRYLVVPVRHAAGVFHPKLYLVVGKSSAVGLVGSSNCTSAGIAYNLELASIFSTRVDNNGVPPSSSATLVKKVYEAFRKFSEQNVAVGGFVEQRVFEKAEQEYPWLRQDKLDDATAGNVAFLNSLERPLLEQVKERLDGRIVDKISIISPFHDSDLRTLSHIASEWPGAELEMVAQPKYSRLPTSPLASIFSSGLNGRLLAATTPPGRRLHAKALAFRTDAGTFWLMGSANATEYGLGGGNTETGLCFFATFPFESIFEDQQVTLAEIDPEDFEPGEIEEPGVEKTDPPSREIALRSVVLTEDGRLELEASVKRDVTNLRLAIRNLRDEFISLSVNVSLSATGTARANLEPAQVVQIERAAICELLADYGEDRFTSNPVALVQLNRLFQQPGNSGNRGNPLKNIVETGEGLGKYVDALGHVQEVIEFYRQTNIRFNDGMQGRSGRGSQTYRPRDPFVPDTPPGWGSIPVGGDVEELRESIRDFVKRHQKQKLERHVKRGNINGLGNFLDIFRTTNSELFKWHSRHSETGDPIIPHGYVVPMILTNIELLIGMPFDEGERSDGFIGAIKRNLQSERVLVLARLENLQVASMVRAAIEAALDVRENALQLGQRDRWAMRKLRWVDEWTAVNALERPTHEEIEAAILEYRSWDLAA